VHNAAHAVLRTVEEPRGGRGKFYSVVDEHAPSEADRLLAMAAAMGIDDVELVSLLHAASDGSRLLDLLVERLARYAVPELLVAEDRPCRRFVGGKILKPQVLARALDV
jgi:hypothetical protein